MAEKAAARFPPERPSAVTFQEGSEGPSRSERREFDRRIVRAAVISSLVVVVTAVSVVLLWRLRALMLLVVVSLFAAAVLHPIVRFVQRLGLRRKVPQVFGRGMATLVVFIIAIAAAAAIVAVLLHPVITEATRFAASLPQLVSQAQ